MAPEEPAPLLTPIRLSLLTSWGCALLAASAVAVLLRGVMSLSERRRVFVSAVTHELRTPLTTFRMYTDMLADGMVRGEEKRRDYLVRLRGEAERLGHLVENVLFYARLESGRAGATTEALDLGDFLERVKGRLAERVERAGMQLVVELGEGERPVEVRVDTSALEQILVNLVDNACKYAGSAEERLIHLRLERDGARALVRVADHGPGISRRDRQRLFRPFSKSDREAANSAPGVGLGLALSYRLARALGGDLRLDEEVKGGACFVLALPTV
jgi:signal transduction histidine kinase